MHSREYGYIYDDKSIPYKVWLSDDSRNIRMIIFLGTVQIGMMPKWVAEKCPSGTAVVEGAPYWFARADGSDMHEYMFNYAKSAYDSLSKDYDFENLSVLAESQAAPAAVRMFTQEPYSKFVQKLILLQPLGFNAHKYPGSNDQKMRVFRRRILKNLIYQMPASLCDEKWRYSYRALSSKVSFRDRTSRAHYASGLKYDATADLSRSKIELDNITIICGTNDQLFPPGEIKETLDRKNLPIDLIEIKGAPHSPLFTKAGYKLLSSAFWVVN